MRVLTLVVSALLLSGCAQLFTSNRLPPLVPITERQDIVSESYSMSGQEDLVGAYFWQEAENTKAILLSPTQVATYKNSSQINSATLENKAISKPVVSGALVYFTNETSELVAFNHEIGALEWRVKLEQPRLSEPVVGAQHIYLQTQNGQVLAVSKQSRKVVWQYARKMPILTIETNGKPTLDKGVLYTGFADGYLVALNAISGEVIWERRMATPRGRTEIARLIAVNTPLIADESVVASIYHGSLTRLSLNGDHIYWREKVSSKKGALLAGERLLVIDDKNNLQAFSLKTGEREWHQPLLRRRKPTVLALTAEEALIGDGYGFIHLMRMSDGELLGRIALEGRTSFNYPALMKDGKYTTVSSKGTFHHLAIKDIEETENNNETEQETDE